MDKKRFSTYLSALVGIACMAGGALASCQMTGQQQPTPEKSTALFDYFTYKGCDDFYAHNPLPDSTAFYNPLLPGWYSDPSVCTNGEGDYFLVASTFSYFPGVPIFHSRDLVNWRQVGHVLDRPSQLQNLAGQGVSGGIFAPAISYNPHNKTFYMVTTNVGVGNFFVKTQNPFGAWSEPILLPSVGGIDPSFLFDNDGKAYIVNNDEAPDGKPEYDGHRTIRIQEFDPETDTTVGPRKILVNKGARPQDRPIWIEGPHLYHIGNRYFLMAAEGGTGDNHSEVIFSSSSPMGPFVPWEKNPILTQRHLDPMRANPITCAGHADLIQTREGDWWAVFLACRPIKNSFENLGRETFLMPVRWSTDGFPYITQGNELIPMVAQRTGVANTATTQQGNFTADDAFDTDSLGLTWLTLRGPATGLYALDKVPGYLQLKCSPVQASQKDVPAYVGRRMQHHKYECTTRMLFQPADETEAAGMLLFKDEAHHYFMGVSRDAEGHYIALWQADKDGTYHQMAKQALAGPLKAVDLKVRSMGTTYSFCYATAPDRWETLADNVDAGYLSTKVAGGFTGSTIGLYAVKRP